MTLDVYEGIQRNVSENFYLNLFRSDVALIYNDRAVLENHHVSAAFRLMRIDDYNILSEFSSDEYKYVYRSFRQKDSFVV
jgi:calcium/calmodulin-dependent 3',5'-cyclic nucleotide phosphodiesterase